MQFFLSAAACAIACSLAPAQTGADRNEAWESYRAHVAAANAAQRLGEASDCRRWLDGAPEQFRNWEWSYIDAASDQSLKSWALGDSLGWIAISPDGATIATTSYDETSIRLWNAATMTPRGVLDGHTAAVFKFRFSPDGTRLVSASSDRTARVWDLSTGACVCTYSGHKFPVASCAFSPDGASIITSSYELVPEPQRVRGNVHMWDAASGELRVAFTGGRKPIVDIAFTPDAAKVVAGTWDSTVFIWNAGTPGEPAVTCETGHEPSSSEHVDGIVVAPGGSLVYGVASDRAVHTWDTGTGERRSRVVAHAEKPTCVALSPDGTILATGAEDDVVKLWDTATWKELATLRGHAKAVRAMAWAPDGSRLYSVALDGTLRAWSPDPSRYGGLHFRHGGSNYAVGLGADGATMATCGSDGRASVFDTRTGERLANWEAHPDGEVCTATMSPDASRVLTCSWDKTARVFDRHGKELLKLDHPGGLAFARFSPDGSTIITACNDKKVRLWNGTTGELVRELEGHGGAVNWACFSPDGSMLASSARDGSVRTWDASSGAPIAEMKGHKGSVQSVAFSPDGTGLASGGADGTVRLWGARTGAPMRTLFEGDQAVHCLSFSPDGTRLAAATEHTILIDVERGGDVLTIRSPAHSIWSLTFMPDGRRLAASPSSGEVIFYDTAPARGRE